MKENTATDPGSRWTSTTRKLHAFRLLGAVLLAATASNALAAEQGQTPSASVTDEIAAEHLFLQISDGPHAALYRHRSRLMADSGLLPAQVDKVIAAANAYISALVPLGSQAAAIHRQIKDKALLPVVATPQLKSLDEKRGALLAQTISGLKVTLGDEGAGRLQTFLDRVIKPSIVISGR